MRSRKALLDGVTDTDQSLNERAPSWARFCFYIGSQSKKPFMIYYNKE